MAREFMSRPGGKWAKAAFEVTNAERRLVLHLRFTDVSR